MFQQILNQLAVRERQITLERSAVIKESLDDVNRLETIRLASFKSITMYRKIGKHIQKIDSKPPVNGEKEGKYSIYRFSKRQNKIIRIYEEGEFHNNEKILVTQYYYNRKDELEIKTIDFKKFQEVFEKIKTLESKY